METTMQPPSLCLVKQLGPHLVPQIPLVPPGHHPLVPLALEVLKWEVWGLPELLVNLKPKHRVNKVKVRLIFKIYIFKIKCIIDLLLKDILKENSSFTKL